MTYPNNIANFTKVSGDDPMTDHAQRHDDEQDGIEEVQRTLGTNPQGTFTSVKNRLDGTDTAIEDNATAIAASDEKIDEHTFDIVYYDERLAAIEEYLGATPTKEVRGRGQWGWSGNNNPPPSSSNAVSNSLVFTEITDVWLNKKDLLSSTTTGMIDTRPGDTISIGKANNFGVADTGTYLVREFEVQNSKGEANENGDVFYMKVEYQSDLGGALQQSFGTVCEMYKFGMRFTK